VALRPLRLKSEVVSAPIITAQGEGSIVDVWVDAGVYHLDSTFTYSIPIKYMEQISVGSMVMVPFHGREITAVVVARRTDPTLKNLKNISKVLGDIPLLSSSIIELIRLASERYAAHPFDLIRSAVPSRVVGVEKEFAGSAIEEWRLSSIQGVRKYLQLPPVRSRSELIANKVREAASNGGVLVVLPDSREVNLLQAALAAYGVRATVFDSSQGKSEGYKSFLEVRLGITSIVIGTRSAIFAPIHNLKSVYIYNEGSEHFYEQRSPGWNVRDIAFLRHHIEGLNLTFIGYCPSTEVARLIDEEWIDFKRTRAKVKVSAFESSMGELLPSRAIPRIRKALEIGPVLFLVPLKGYAQAIRCSKCRTISRCECGGAHEKRSSNASISCAHCLKTVPEWRCAWCSAIVPLLGQRGIERHQQEIGALFPKIAIHFSTVDHSLGSIDSGIVLTTPGMAPVTPQGYSAVVVLEADRFLSQPDMRAQERVRELIFAHSALVSVSGEVIVIGDSSHPIVTALTSWNPSMIIHQELQERSSLHLPPYARVARFTLATDEATRFKSALLKAKDEGLIPSNTEILGPIPFGDKSSLIISTPVADGEALIKTLHEFMRRRSTAKKLLPTMRIDPYSLSH